jgi:hypothetical protein
MTEREARIRERAYELWEADGRREGSSDEYWNRAAREIDEQSGESHEDQEARQAMRDEPPPVPDIGRASILDPGGGTTPASTSVGTSPPVGGTRKRSKR